jgi:hypothetical protein
MAAKKKPAPKAPWSPSEEQEAPESAVTPQEPEVAPEPAKDEAKASAPAPATESLTFEEVKRRQKNGRQAEINLVGSRRKKA